MVPGHPPHDAQVPYVKWFCIYRVGEPTLHIHSSVVAEETHRVHRVTVYMWLMWLWRARLFYLWFSGSKGWFLPFKNGFWGFPGGAVVENPPANAGDTGSSPGPGRSHMPRSNWAREPQLLSLRVWSLAPQQERPRQWEARAPWWRVAPARRN